jgi:hypothetical protein
MTAQGVGQDQDAEKWRGKEGAAASATSAGDRIIEDGAALDTTNLARSFAVCRHHIID